MAATVEQPDITGAQVAGGDTLTVGDITCRVIRDGWAPYPVETIFSAGSADAARPLLGSRLDAEGNVASTYHCVLLETPAGLALVDTGLGQLSSVAGVPAGRLVASLAAAGRTPDDIDVVVVSHAHPDHIGGLVSGGRLTFPRARHVMSATEWAYWTSEDQLTRLPEIMASPARAMLPPLAAGGALDLVDGEAEVLPGVYLLPAPGHTPGHCVVTVRSGGEEATLLADAIIDVLQFGHPAWVSEVDHEPDQTVRTRAQLLQEAAADGRPVMAYHIGSFGRVEAASTGYDWQSA